MNLIYTITLSVLSLPLITACGKKDGPTAATGPEFYSFYTLEGQMMNAEGTQSKQCSTGKIVAVSAEDLCRRLANDKLNNFCAEKEREELYKTSGCEKAISGDTPTLPHSIDGNIGDHQRHDTVTLIKDDYTGLFDSTSINLAAIQYQKPVTFTEMQSRIRETENSRFDLSDLPHRGVTEYEYQFKDSNKSISVGVTSNSENKLEGFFGSDQIWTTITNDNWKYRISSLSRPQIRYQARCIGKLLKDDVETPLEEVEIEEEFRWLADEEVMTLLDTFSEIKEKYEIPFHLGVAVLRGARKDENQIRFHLDMRKMESETTPFELQHKAKSTRYFSLKYRPGTEDNNYDQLELECQVHPLKR